MWIIPKNYTPHTSVFVPDMEESTWDCETFSRICTQQLTVRSNFMRFKYYLNAWKKNTLIRRLYTQTLKPFLGYRLEAAFQFYRVGSHVSLSQMLQTTRKESKIHDISIHTSAKASNNPNQQLSFWKMFSESSKQKQKKEVA